MPGMEQQEMFMGRAFMILYKFPRSFIHEQSFIRPALISCFRGGWGRVIVAEYLETPAGKFAELLFIPGKFHIHQGRFYSASKVFVSPGEKGFPGNQREVLRPEKAKIVCTSAGNKVDHIAVSRNGEEFLNISLKILTPGFPWPVSVFPPMLAQEYQGRYYIIRYRARGWAQMARITSLSVNPDFFPDLRMARPLLALKIEELKLYAAKPLVLNPKL